MGVVEIKCSGGTAKVPTNVPHGQQIVHWLKGGFYEAPFLEYLRANYRGGMWVDGGSAIGNHTLFFAKFCETSWVVSIDPIGSSLDLQRQILGMNGVRAKVYTVQAALGATVHAGYMRKFGPGVGHWQLAEDGEPVPVVTLDSLELDNVQVLKLDVEGSELEALKGASALLLEQRPAVFTECNTQQEVDAIAAYLKRFDYRKTGNRWHTMHEWRAK